MQNHEPPIHTQQVSFEGSAVNDVTLIENEFVVGSLNNSVEYNRARFYAETMSHLLPASRMLDFNAQIGIRMLGFNYAGWQVEGLESDPELVAEAEKQSNQKLHAVDALSFETTRRFDLIVATNIVDHAEKAEDLVAKIVSLNARDGYVLVEHNRSTVNLRDNISCRQQLAQTDRLFNQAGYARIDWGRTPREARSELFKAALKNQQGMGSVSRLLTLPLQLLPDGLEVKVPDFGCLYSIYQKAQSDLD